MYNGRNLNYNGSCFNMVYWGLKCTWGLVCISRPYAAEGQSPPPPEISVNFLGVSFFWDLKKKTTLMQLERPGKCHFRPSGRFFVDKFSLYATRQPNVCRINILHIKTFSLFQTVKIGQKTIKKSKFAQ